MYLGVGSTEDIGSAVIEALWQHYGLDLLFSWSLEDKAVWLIDDALGRAFGPFAMLADEAVETTLRRHHPWLFAPPAA